MAYKTDDKRIAIAISKGLGRVEFIFDDDDVLDLLRTAIEQEGSQVAFAQHHGIDRTYLSKVLSGKRPVGDSIAEALGLHKAYVVSSPAADGCETEIAPKAMGELIDA